MEWHFLRVVDERTNVGLQCTLVDKLLPLIEILMSRKASEFSEISQVYFRAGWKELTAVMNWSSSSLLDEVAPTVLVRGS